MTMVKICQNPSSFNQLFDITAKVLNYRDAYIPCNKTNQIFIILTVCIKYFVTLKKCADFILRRNCFTQFIVLQYAYITSHKPSEILTHAF